MSVRIITGDCRDVLKTLADESVHCVVTDPPYGAALREICIRRKQVLPRPDDPEEMRWAEEGERK